MLNLKVNNKEVFLSFPKPQIEATFLSRPQRFLAEMVFAENETIFLAYCANPGSLHGCLLRDSPALLWDSEEPKRKRRYTWRAVQLNGVWVGTDTHLANRIVEEAFIKNLIPGFEQYEKITRESRVGKGYRIDFLLSGANGDCYVEVKSSSVVENGIARFPDSNTPRSVRHLEVLTQMAKEGKRAILLYLIQRDDVSSFSVNERSYPAYAVALKKAVEVGVESLALSVSVSIHGFSNPRLLPVNF